MNYLIVFISLSLLMYAYITWAGKVGIIDTPNARSSHQRPTIRGGGIIFPVAVLLWAGFFGADQWFFVSAVVLIAFIGFLDDRYSLSQLPRLLVQSVAVALLIWQVNPEFSKIWVLLILFVFITGWLNTFNFMDGINGISVLYCGAVVGGVYLFRHMITHIPDSLFYVLIISLLIFGFLNVRKKAIVFAGDVGSLSLGIIIAYLVASLILSTGRWEFILMLSVYGIDSVLTIVHRIIKRENIFEAHRSHFYQYLANEMNWPHLIVSMIYAMAQFIIILSLYLSPRIYWTEIAISALVILSVIYTCGKFMILQKLDKA